MKDMLLPYGEPEAGPAPGTPEFGQMLKEYMAAIEDMRRADVLFQRSARTRVDVGLILPGTPPTGRLELAAKFNPLFTHRVRITALEQVDDELTRWLSDACRQSGRV